MLLGVIVSAVLHGVCLLQAFIYFTRMDSSSHLVIINACSNFIRHRRVQAGRIVSEDVGCNYCHFRCYPSRVYHAYSLLLSHYKLPFSPQIGALDMVCRHGSTFHGCQRRNRSNVLHISCMVFEQELFFHTSYIDIDLGNCWMWNSLGHYLNADPDIRNTFAYLSTDDHYQRSINHCRRHHRN
jgi:hypothetical protein